MVTIITKMSVQTALFFCNSGLCLKKGHKVFNNYHQL